MQEETEQQANLALLQKELQFTLLQRAPTTLADELTQALSRWGSRKSSSRQRGVSSQKPAPRPPNRCRKTLSSLEHRRHRHLRNRKARAKARAKATRTFGYPRSTQRLRGGSVPSGIRQAPNGSLVSWKRISLSREPRLYPQQRRQSPQSCYLCTPLPRAHNALVDEPASLLLPCLRWQKISVCAGKTQRSASSGFRTQAGRVPLRARNA